MFGEMTAKRRATTILPPWLVALVVTGAALLAGVVLEVTDSVVLALAVAALSWLGVRIARRARAARGIGPRFDSLPSGWMDEDLSAWRQAAAQIAAGLGCLAVAIALMGLLWLLSIEHPVDGELDATVLIGLIAAFPAGMEIDTWLGVYGARRRAEAEQRLREIAEGARGTALRTTIELPLARGRLALNVGVLLAFAAGSSALGLVAGDMTQVESAILVAGGVLFVVVAVLLSRLFGRPYFMRVTSDGVDPLGHGVVPWEAIMGFEVRPMQMTRWLAIALADDVPQAQPWWRPGHKGLGRRLRNRALLLPLRFCAASDGEALAAVQAYDKPVLVDLA